MSQPVADQKSLTSSSRFEKDGDKADGYPKTPYAIAVLVTGVITAYSAIFKTWDGSDFPETFYNSNYWFLLCLILLLFALMASLVRDKKRGLDLAIVIALFAASAGSLIVLVIIDRQARPSDKTFTVVVFTFTNHTSTEGLSASFRDNIRKELEIEYPNNILVLERDRELKGERLEEKTNNARNWGMRRSGCHLAVWGELSTDPSGHNHVSLHSVTVSPFGTQLNHNDLGTFDNLNWNMTSTQPNSGSAIGKETVDFATSRIVFSYGLANYDKADYGAALRILSTVGIPTSEFFAGRAAYEAAKDSKRAREMFKESEKHFLQAIALDKEGAILSTSYTHLGFIYNSMLSYGVSEDPREAAGKAITAYSKAAEIYEKAGDQPNAAGLLVKKGLTLLNLYVLTKDEDSVGAKQALDEAEVNTLDALNRIDAKSEYYPEAESLLGAIYSSKGYYDKAIEANEIALNLIQSQDYRREVLIDLARAQTNSAWKKKDRALHEKGMKNFEQAFQGCPAASQDIDCHLAHLDAGIASLNWTSRELNGSPDWWKEIQRALAEFNLAANFVSKTEQPTYYAEVKRLSSMANTELGWVTRGDERANYFKTALIALTDGINALSDAHRESVALRDMRAQCYRRLADDLPDGAAKDEYIRLAREDQEFVKAPKKTAIK